MAQAYVYEDDATGWRHIVAGDIPSGAGSPLTTKGDLYGFSTVNARVPVGADNTVLTADSTQALGVKWAAGGGAGTISDITSTGGSITVGAPTGPTTNVDVAASGVTAATYGDASHVARVVVGADGRVTAASNVAIAPASSGSWALIYSSTLGADGAGIDTGANAIPNTYTHLVVIIYARTAYTGVTSPQFVVWQFNGDSGATNYTSSAFGANVNTLSGGAIQGIAAVAATSQTGFDANAFGSATIYLPLYSTRTKYQSWNGTSSGLWKRSGGNFTAIIDGFYENTATAINRINLFAASGDNLKAGSAMFVYGIA